MFSTGITTDFKPKFSGFHDLMKFRVREILLVSSLYDAFVLEEDGRLAERIFSEYIDLNLHFIPRITKVSSAEEAFAALKAKSFDLVITMARIADMNPIEFGRKVKEFDPEKMVVLLTYDVIDPVMLQNIRQAKGIDKVFYWFGESKLMLALIKYVEDAKNVENDIQAGVQVILLIEDSPKYYSMFLPSVYAEIMVQTRNLIQDGVNDLHRLLRMRARPKILLADSFEEGMAIYETYKHNMLGIISDVRFPREGRLDDEAGFKFARKVKKEVPDLPILLQSAETHNVEKAARHRVTYLNKNSQNLLLELRNFILSEFGFGDFIFRHPDGREIARARNLNQFAEMVPRMPVESLAYHAQRNHISIWLRARTEFELADELRPKKISDFPGIEQLRDYIAKSTNDVLRRMQLGVIKDFGSAQVYADNTFIRLGSGSLGGKGRGLAFINAMLANNKELQEFDDVEIKTPQTFVIGSEMFEEYLETNNLQEFAMNTRDEEKIARRFLEADLPDHLTDQLRALLTRIHFPLAVRSSSLLEDSQSLPFAGLYRTYMLPNNHPDADLRLKQLTDAIRLVYASVFFKAPKEYIKNTEYRIEEEKMAVIIQQFTGIQYGSRFYPVISGVAQSYNYYPISHMRPEEGVVHLALGMGKIITDGERIYRFSPIYPRMNLPYGSPLEFMENSQTTFYALDLSRPDIQLDKNEGFDLIKAPVSGAEADGTLFFVGSTYSPEDGAIRDTVEGDGPRVITFANILKYNIFPLAEILENLLELGKNAFGTHVEIEFSINLYKKNIRKPEFFILQIRPMIAMGDDNGISLESNDLKQTVCRSRHAIGNGIYSDLYDLVYVDPDVFNTANTREIARELEEINERLADDGRNYILMGFGRWGTSDPWLGIPVEWHQISRAKVLIESNLPDFKVDPSSGSHFFHNLISLRLGYFYIRSDSQEEFIAWDWLRSRKALNSHRFVRHLRFKKPLLVKIDGRSSRGIIFRPDGAVF